MSSPGQGCKSQGPDSYLSGFIITSDPASIFFGGGGHSLHLRTTNKVHEIFRYRLWVSRIHMVSEQFLDLFKAFGL
jgi:hypothetical protein